MLDLDIKIRYTSKTLITVEISEVEVGQRKSYEKILRELQSFPPKIEKIMIGVRLHEIELTRVLPLYRVLKNLSLEKKVIIKCYGYTSLAGLVLVRAATPGYRLASQFSLTNLRCNIIKSKLIIVKLLKENYPELIVLSRYILDDDINNTWVVSDYLIERKLVDRVE